MNAAVAGLRGLRRPEQVAQLRGRDVHEIAPQPMLEAVAAADVRLQAARTKAPRRSTPTSLRTVTSDAARAHGGRR